MTPFERDSLAQAARTMATAIESGWSCWPATVRSYCADLLEAADEESERRKEAHEDKGTPPAPGHERG